MALFPRSRATVGLDIGSGYIKAVTINHGSGQPVLERVAIAKVADDAIVEGEVMDPTVVADAVRSLLGKANTKSRDVVVAVGGRDVIIKKIQMDRMKEAEAREVIRWEADQHVPFDPENVELDFQILDPDGDGLQMQVLLVAAKRELVESKLALLAEIGVDASVIDVEAFALHNAFEHQLSRSDARRGRAGQRRARNHHRQPARRRRAGADPRPADRRAPPARGSAARTRHGGRRGRPGGPRRRPRPGAGAPRRLARRGTGARHRAGGGVPADLEPSRSARSRGSTSPAAGRACPGLAGVLSDRLRVPVTQAHAVERLDVAAGPSTDSTSTRCRRC